MLQFATAFTDMLEANYVSIVAYIICTTFY